MELLVRDYEAMSGKKMTLNEFEKRFGRYRADMIAAGTFSAEELGGYWQKIMEKLKGRRSSATRSCRAPYITGIP